MHEAWYEKARHWLEFRVCSDGFDDTDDKLLAPHPATPAGSFSCFGNFPPEIRLLIWEATIQPRIVLTACFNPQNEPAKRAQLTGRARKRQVPVILHVCHESRQLALRHYELTFSWKVSHQLAPSDPGLNQSDARVWFNFNLDSLLFLGELEPFDQDGFNAPMIDFLRREDTERVRHVACALEELHLGLDETDGILNSLLHILDRFPALQRLLLTATPEDRKVKRLHLATSDNAIQRVWSGWLNGTSVVTSSLAKKQILMIREEDMASFIAEHG